MAKRAPTDLLSFRRTFALLIVLVVVPSAGLSGFGVLAIVNERAAVEKRLQVAWSGRLEAVTRAFGEALEGAQLPEAGQTVVSTPAGPVELDASFEVRDGRVETSDARLSALLSPLVPELTALPERPVVLSVSTHLGTAVLLAHRQGERTYGARLDLPSLEALLARLGEPLIAQTEHVAFVLRPVKRESGEGLVGKLVSEVAHARDSAQVLADRVLPAPLQDLRVVAMPVGTDPVARASTRNRVVYTVLLVLFYATLAIGVVYTARALYREARLSRLKTDFVTLVSHELRTPLTSIRMFIDTLAMGRVRDEAQTREVLTLLSRETERLSELIERVLDWARIESGRKEYKRQRTPVAAIVERAVEAFRAQRLKARVDLRVELEPELPPVDVDPDALAGAVLNLLQNAFKYTGQDKRIVVRARRSGRTVRLEVEDNGHGIDPRDHRRIFERFYRADDLLTRRTEGSGLGLAISKRIIEAHGGRITVTSELGRGSTFTVKLPASSGKELAA